MKDNLSFVTRMVTGFLIWRNDNPLFNLYQVVVGRGSLCISLNKGLVRDHWCLWRLFHVCKHPSPCNVMTSQCYDVTSTLIAIQCDSLCANCCFLETGIVDNIGVLQTPTRIVVDRKWWDKTLNTSGRYRVFTQFHTEFLQLRLIARNGSCNSLTLRRKYI